MSLSARYEEKIRDWAKNTLGILRERKLVVEGTDREIVDKTIENAKDLLDKGYKHSSDLTALAFVMAAEKYSTFEDELYNILGVEDFAEKIQGNPWRKFCKSHNLEERDWEKRYEIKKELGEGRYGTVFLAYDKKRKKDVALKILEFVASRDQINELKSELNALQKLSYKKNGCSRYVSCLYDWYCIEDKLPKSTLIISMEYIQGKELWTYQPKTKKEAEKIVKGLVLGVKHLQDNNIIHMDLHGGNVLVDKAGQSKIIDFGLSCYVGYMCGIVTKTTNFGGFEKLRPPEMVNKSIESTIGAYKRADIWMLGRLIERTLRKNPDLQELYQGLIKRMVSKDPTERPTIGEVLATIGEFQKFKKKIGELATSMNRKTWEIHHCAKSTSLVHKVSFGQTMKFLQPLIV